MTVSPPGGGEMAPPDSLTSGIPALNATAAQRIARAIADPSRYEILRTLASSSCDTPCSAVRNCVDLAPPTLSHHMKELRDAGLVDEEHVGRTVRYTLRREVLEAFNAFLQQTLITPGPCAAADTPLK